MNRVCVKRHITSDGNNLIFISNRLSMLMHKKSLKGNWTVTYFKIKDNIQLSPKLDYYIDLVCPTTNTLVLVKANIREKMEKIRIKRTMGKWMEV